VESWHEREAALFDTKVLGVLPLNAMV